MQAMQIYPSASGSSPARRHDRGGGLVESVSGAGIGRGHGRESGTSGGNVAARPRTL